MGANIILIVIVFQFVLIIVSVAVLLKSLHKPLKSRALVRTGMGGTKVILEGAVFVFPKMHQLEEIDLSIKIFNLRQMVYCKDQTVATLDVLFYIQVNRTPVSVQEVATNIGAKRTFDQEALKEIFEPKFSEALKKVAAEVDSSTLKTQQVAVKLEILKALGTELNGYELDDCIIQAVETANTI